MLAITLLAALSWALAPQLLALAARMAVPADWQVEIDSARPRISGVQIHSLVIRHPDGWQVGARTLQLHWQWGAHAAALLPWLDLAEVHIAELRFDLSAVQSGPEPASMPTPATLRQWLPDRWLPRLPVQELQVDGIVLLPPATTDMGPLSGSLSARRDQALEVRLTGADGMRMDMTAAVDGRVTLDASGGHGYPTAQVMITRAGHDSVRIERAELQHPDGWRVRLEQARLDWTLPASATLPGDVRARIARLALDLRDLATPAQDGQDAGPDLAGLDALLSDRWLKQLPLARLDVDSVELTPPADWPVEMLGGNLRLQRDTTEGNRVELQLTGRWRQPAATAPDPASANARVPGRLAEPETAVISLSADGQVTATLTSGAGERIASATLRRRPELAPGTVDVRADLPLQWWAEATDVPLAGDLQLAARLAPDPVGLRLDILPGTHIDAHWQSAQGASLRVHGQPQFGADIAFGDGWQLRLADPLVLGVDAAQFGTWELTADAVMVDPQQAAAHLRATATNPVAGVTRASIDTRVSAALDRGQVTVPDGGRIELLPSPGLPLESGPVTLLLTRPLSIQPGSPTLPSAHIAVSSPRLRIPALAPVDLGAVHWDGSIAPGVDGEAKVNGELRIGALAATTRGHFNATGDGKVGFEVPPTSVTAAPLPRLVRQFQPDLTLTAGELGASGQLVVDGAAGARLMASATIDSLAFMWADQPGTAQRINTAASGPLDALQLGPTMITAASLSGATSLTDVHVSIGALPAARLVGDIDGSMATMGGRITFSCPAFDLESTSGTCQVALDGLELQQVVALEQQALIAASGAVAGEMTLEFEAGEPRARGALQARGGGHLRYVADPSVLASADSAGLGLALRALEDFTYTDLGARLTLDADGNLHLDATLQGRNPAVEGGRPIRFNLGIDNEGFWRALQLTRGITDNLERRLRTQP